MSWNYNNFGYSHDPLEDSHSSERDTTSMDETHSSLLEELHKVRDQMITTLNSSSKSYGTPCRDQPLPPPQYPSYPSPPYSPGHHEPYKSFTYEHSPSPYRSYQEPPSPFQPYPLPHHSSYQTTYHPPPRDPSPPPKPVKRKSSALDAFFDYPNMDDLQNKLEPKPQLEIPLAIMQLL